MQPRTGRVTASSAEQMSLGLSSTRSGESAESPGTGVTPAAPLAPGAVELAAATTTASADALARRRARRSWAERAADDSLGRTARGRRGGDAAGAASTGSLEAHIARALAALGPAALRAYADALSDRLTTDRAAGVARLAVLLRDRLVHALRETLRALAMPIVPLRERLLLVPVSGPLDRARARDLTDALLYAVHAHRARVVVVDLAEVARADAAAPTPVHDGGADAPAETAGTQNIASHLLHAARATRLLGASLIVSGPPPTLAQALTQLGADARALRIAPDLSAGVREAERMLDHIVPTHAIAQVARWSTTNV